MFVYLGINKNAMIEYLSEPANRVGVFLIVGTMYLIYKMYKNK